MIGTIQPIAANMAVLSRILILFLDLILIQKSKYISAGLSDDRPATAGIYVHQFMSFEIKGENTDLLLTEK